MKIGIATALSVAGIIAAGSAAFALNTAVLSDSDTATGPDREPAVAVTDTVSTGSPAAASADVTASSVKVSDTVTTYSVGSSGKIVVDTSSGGFVVTDVIPSAGWTSEPARTEPDGSVKVHFTNGRVRLEITGRMSNGAAKISVISEPQPAGTVMPPSPKLPAAGTQASIPPSMRGGDDDDEDHEEREHDSEGHHDDGDEDDD